MCLKRVGTEPVTPRIGMLDGNRNGEGERPEVVRNNTVAERPGPRPGQKPRLDARGGGLPSGPRMGLPSGPRPRRV